MGNIILDTRDGAVNMHVQYATMNLFRMGLLDYHQMAYLHQAFARDSGKVAGNLTIVAVQVYMPVFDYIVARRIFNIGK